MKIIISDYDGTIFEDEITTKKNIAAIARFRNQNLFAVATGRSYEDFMSAKIKNNIELDYYLLNYGAQILDKNMQPISITPLTKEDVAEIKKFFKEKNVTILYCNDKKNSLKESGAIFKIVVKFNNRKDLVDSYKQFIKLDSFNTYILKNHCSLEIIRKDVNKKESIKKFLPIIKMKQNDVFVIGDSINDLEMITQYHGFCVENAEPNIKAVAVKIYPHVYNLIEELMEAK